MPGIYIALDIGGTKILTAAADENGRWIRRRRESTPLDLTEGLTLLKDLIADLAAGDNILGIGAATGGPMDHRNGIVSPLHQPQWREVPLKRTMEEAFAAPFAVEVDTDAAVLGEWTHGSLRADRMLYLTVSTGMGGGFLIDGEIYRGGADAHPEVAHQAIPFRCRYPRRVRCDCGAPDCLEALVSGSGIRRIYGKPAEELSGDEWTEVGYNFGQGLRNIISMYAPTLIVLGGSVALGGGSRLLDPAVDILNSHLKLVPIPEICPSSLAEEAPLNGALALAMLAAQDGSK